MRRQSFGTVLVRPSTLLREGLAPALVAADFRIIASASHVPDFAQIPPSHDQPLLLIVDAREDPEGAVAQIELFKQRNPSGRVAVLADHYCQSDLISAYRAGANAYFVNAMSCGAFIKALELIMLGETILPPELLSFIGDGDDHHEHPPTALNQIMTGDASQPIGTDAVPRLSPREKCILRCVVEGDSNKAIARKISIAEATVKVHVKAILRKVRLNNRTQAAIWAINNSSLIWSGDTDSPPPEMMVVPVPLAPEQHNGANHRRRL
jgi:DNA-binding NarL/FixJ family response regulator